MPVYPWLTPSTASSVILTCVSFPHDLQGGQSSWSLTLLVICAIAAEVHEDSRVIWVQSIPATVTDKY